MNDTGMTGGQLVAVSEARNACKGEPLLLERIRKAMRVCYDHWMETNEGRQFKAAIAAAYLESPKEEQKRILDSTTQVNQMDAFLHAAQAGIEATLPAPPDDLENIIPLLGLWHEIKYGKSA